VIENGLLERSGWGERKREIWWWFLRERGHLEYTGIDGTMILKLVFKKQNEVDTKNILVCVRIHTVCGPLGRGSGILSFKYVGNFVTSWRNISCLRALPHAVSQLLTTAANSLSTYNQLYYRIMNSNHFTKFVIYTYVQFHFMSRLSHFSSIDVKPLILRRWWIVCAAFGTVCSGFGGVSVQQVALWCVYTYNVLVCRGI